MLCLPKYRRPGAGANRRAGFRGIGGGGGSGVPADAILDESGSAITDSSGDYITED